MTKRTKKQIIFEKLYFKRSHWIIKSRFHSAKSSMEDGCLYELDALSVQVFVTCFTKLAFSIFPVIALFSYFFTSSLTFDIPNFTSLALLVHKLLTTFNDAFWVFFCEGWLAISANTPLIPKTTWNHFLTNGLFGQVETTFTVNTTIFVVCFTILNFTMTFSFFKGRIALLALRIFALLTTKNNTFQANIIHEIVAILTFFANFLSFWVFVLDAIFNHF